MRNAIQVVLLWQLFPSQTTILLLMGVEGGEKLLASPCGPLFFWTLQLHFVLVVVIAADFLGIVMKVPRSLHVLAAS